MRVARMDSGDGTPAGLALPRGALWVRMPRFIGDAVMIHQALEPLRAAGLPLVAWGPPPVIELFRGSAAFAGTWADGPERGRSWAARALLRAAEARGLLNLPRSTRALVAAWMARVPLRVGWSGAGGMLFATCSRPFRSAGHQLESYRRLLAAAFPELAPAAAVPFRPRPEAMTEARQALARLGLAAEAPVVLALGAMTGNKRLGTGLWIELIRRLRQAGIGHLLLGGPGEDQAQAAAIRAALPGVPDLTGRLALAAGAGVIAQARALVGNDSGLSHLAAACATPALVVFGPTRPRRTAPAGSRVRILRREDLPCLECFRFDCPVPGHPCMEGLAPDRLFRELEELLAGRVQALPERFTAR